MHSIFLVLIAIGCLCINSFIFGWFSKNKNNNKLHMIVKLWTSDPIESAYLENINNDCQEDLSEENVTLNYSGFSGICQCQQSSKPIEKNPYFIDCSSECDQNDYTKTTYASNKISQQKLETFFASQGQEQQIRYKICISRIEGYSFAKKAPEKQGCDDDEKYCSWSNNDEFYIDHGYCIPKDRVCYKNRVLLESEINGFGKLPLVQFSVDDYEYDLYDYQRIKNIREEELLKMNEINYPQEYEPYLKKEYIFQNAYMPKVELRCRKFLKETLQNYVGPDSIYPIALAIMIFTIFYLVLQMAYTNMADFCDKNGIKGCFDYCQKKRINSKNSIPKNVFFIAKPIVLLILLILNLIIHYYFSVTVQKFKQMIKDECFDDKLNVFIKYVHTKELADQILYEPKLTYASFGFIGSVLLFDSNLYYLIKTIILFPFSKLKCFNKNKEDQIKIQSSPLVDRQTDGFQNDQLNIQIQPQVQQYVRTNYPIYPQQGYPIQMDDHIWGYNNQRQVGIEQQNASLKSIKFQKYNSNIIIEPPEAPHPPELSEQQNNSKQSID